MQSHLSSFQLFAVAQVVNLQVNRRANDAVDAVPSNLPPMVTARCRLRRCYDCCCILLAFCGFVLCNILSNCMYGVNVKRKVSSLTSNNKINSNNI